MKMVKSLLLGGAAGIVAISGAQAADLPVKAKPVQYVKICSLYGAGFYYIPGTDTCLKLGGFVRAETNFNAGGSYGVPGTFHLSDHNGPWQNWRTRGGISVDARSQTEYGTLRSYVMMAATSDESGATQSGGPSTIQNTGGGQPYVRIWAPAAFIQIAGFTVGKTDTFFAFDNAPYTNSTMYWLSDRGGGGNHVFAYTAQFGNGFSASLSLENADAFRAGIYEGNPFGGSPPGTAGYAPQGWPDIVGNLRIDQAWGSAQISGGLHELNPAAYSLNGVQQHAGDEVGWAIAGGLKFNLPMLGKGDFIQGQLTYTEGANQYITGNNGTSQLQTVTKGSPASSIAYGPNFDAVATGQTATSPGGLTLTKGWSITGGYQHNWSPQWKTSLWGEYGKLDYGDAAAQALDCASATSKDCGIADASWSLWQVGSRTVWTPVQNLDLSVEVMYNNMKGITFSPSAVAGNPALGNNNIEWWSGIFRVQRNFWP